MGGPDYKPKVTVIIPAFNEEKVIENTVRSALASDYPNLRTIVVDDGSKDATSALVREKFAKEIAEGRVLLLTKSNAGKAEALQEEGGRRHELLRQPGKHGRTRYGGACRAHGRKVSARKRCHAV